MTVIQHVPVSAFERKLYNNPAWPRGFSLSETWRGIAPLQIFISLAPFVPCTTYSIRNGRHVMLARLPAYF